MSSWILKLAALAVAGAVGVGAMHTFDNATLSDEQAARANDKQQHAEQLLAMSQAALDGEQRAIDAHSAAESNLAALDAALTKEKEAHEADNARNRRAIADGARRLRIAVTDFHASAGAQADPGTGASRVGDGASGTAELPPAFGVSLFGIVDDADGDARAKADYLQHYVCELRRIGVVTGSCG